MELDSGSDGSVGPEGITGGYPTVAISSYSSAYRHFTLLFVDGWTGEGGCSPRAPFLRGFISVALWHHHSTPPPPPPPPVGSSLGSSLGSSDGSSGLYGLMVIIFNAIIFALMAAIDYGYIVHLNHI